MAAYGEFEPKLSEFITYYILHTDLEPTEYSNRGTEPL